MTLNDDATLIDPPPAPDPPPGGAHLQRSRSRRMLAGVAGGIADRLDVDVSLVRVAFVVLACAWGLGVVVYLALWALVPVEPSSDAPGTRGELEGESTSPWLAALLLAGVLVFGLLVVTTWWRGPRWGTGFGLLWVVLLGVVVLIAVRRPSQSALRAGSGVTARAPRGAILLRAIVILGVGAVTLAIVATGAFFALVASTGVPFTGGIGDRVYQPTSLAQVQPTYRTAIGNLTVDLRRVHFTSRTTRVTASVAVGLLTVEVPPGVVVDVSAHSGFGNVVAQPGDLQTFSGPERVSASGSAAAHPQLDLVAEAGVGQVRLVRGTPT
ncbi:MAG TPA: PspC domain-containing protein [Acidimicrobiales bacterium]|jgi:phage shock protein PspC (stress-responsive transcriptional regulator)|nr:PspC domain-containing protein [Acidimicrobiales bacterium]